MKDGELNTSPETSFVDRPLPSLVLAILIVISIISFSMETLPNLDAATKSFLDITEKVIVSVFTLEYLYRLITAKNKWKFVTIFYGVLDLLSILPFFLALTVDLRSLRVIRLLRVVRIFKLARYNSAVARLSEAVMNAKHELIVSVSILLVAIYLAGVGIYHFEHEAQPDKFRSLFDALWWALSTVTTVGYGDVYPVTVGGRIFTFFVLICSLGLVAVPTGIFASALLSVRNKDPERSCSSCENKKLR